MDVTSRYHLAGLVGKRDLRLAMQVIGTVDRQTGGKPPVFITDGLKHYIGAISSVYTLPCGMFASRKLRETFTRAGPQANLSLQTPGPWHLRVIKNPRDHENERKEFPVLKLIHEGHQVDLSRLEETGIPVTRHINYVERRNFTQRRRCAVLQRKSSAVTQDSQYLQNQVTLERFSYNYCQSHRSLRQKYLDDGKRWIKITPAMKLAITDHIWTLQEALGNSAVQLPVVEKKRDNPTRVMLPEPSVIKISIKESLDWQILKSLLIAGQQGLERSKLCQLVNASRTTVYDHLTILKTKALVIESHEARKSAGRPKTIFHCPWSTVRLSHAENKSNSVLVSDTN